MIRSSGAICRRSAAIVLLLASTLPMAELPAQTVAPERKSLIENGNFEQTEPPRFPAPGWSVWGNSQDALPERFGLDSQNPKAGQYSLKIDHPRNTHAFVVSNPKVPIPTRRGKAYMVSFWSRTANSNEPGVVYWETRTGSSPGQWPIRPSVDWTRQTREIHEGLDFFASETPQIMLAFRPARAKEAEQTLWVDEIVVSEVASTKGRLIHPDELVYEPLNHRLSPGDALRIELDAGKLQGNTVGEVSGQSFHRLSGWGRHPYDDQGNFVLAPGSVEAIRECRLPMTRFYATGVEPWPIDQTLDKLSQLMDQVGIRKTWTVIELEPQGAEDKLSPAFWARAAKYSVDRGYGFRFWEISNEPYTRKATAFDVPDDYVSHVIACSQAIKAQQPGALVGVGLHTTTQGWGNYVLKQAAGHYDFVVGHYYASGRDKSFEEASLAVNYRMLDHILSVNALIGVYNPGRPVRQIDTEWGILDLAVEGQPESRWRNNNIHAAMHRAVRLIHYAREGPLRGASGWEMFSRATEDRIAGLAFLTRDAPEKGFMNYWLYYLFNRHRSGRVLEISGTAPWYRPPADPDGVSSGPMTPVLATLSDDGRTIYLVIANGSWEDNYTCKIGCRGFGPLMARGTILSQETHNAVGLVAKEEVTRELSIQVVRDRLTFTLPGHSIVFITADAAGN